jgi:hypothetical protein
LGWGFSGSVLGFADYPPPTASPLNFVLWLGVTAMVFAPVLLIVIRLALDVRGRGKPNAPN